jgi:hypothetical protein
MVFSRDYTMLLFQEGYFQNHQMSHHSFLTEEGMRCVVVCKSRDSRREIWQWE